MFYPVDNGQQSDSDDQQQQPKTSYYEPLERRMTPGGSITFTCRIGLVDQGRQSIQWYHNEDPISIMVRIRTNLSKTVFLDFILFKKVIDFYC